MQFEFSEAENAFRSRIRDWLSENAPRERRPRAGPSMRAFDLDWQKRKYEAGWGAISWPVEFGGAGLSPVQQMIWHEEAAKAEAPGVGCLSIALGHAGPTVMACGEEHQKKFHLPKILKGEVVWCQGFSEPEAGSDLAGLKTKAVVDGDDLVISGRKIWTSHAQHASYQEMLVRTNPTLGRHKGITWLIVDMTSPGITIRPIDTMAGDQHYCEVFYDDVRVPLSNVVGKVDDGWRVAMTTLATERGGAAASLAAEAGGLVERLVELVRGRGDRLGSGALHREELDARLAQLRAEAAALRAMTYATISRAERGAAPGPESAMAYLYFGELMQRVRVVAMDVLGPEALSLSHDAESWTRGFLADRMFVIAGGSAEVRRNIIAERILGLPRSY